MLKVADAIWTLPGWQFGGLQNMSVVSAMLSLPMATYSPPNLSPVCEAQCFRCTDSYRCETTRHEGVGATSCVFLLFRRVMKNERYPGSKEYETRNTVADPITGGTSAIFWTVTHYYTGIAQIF